MVPDVDNEGYCRLKCKNTSDCLYFTYFDANNSLFPSVCLLLKELNGPFKTCTNCSTAPVECSSKQLSVCGLLKEDKNGNQVERKQLFTSTARVRQVKVGHCRPADLTIVAIGGGGGEGGGLDTCGNYQCEGSPNAECFQGGSGSGYISSTEVPAIFPSLFVQVGSQGKSSFVQGEDGTLLVSAEPGACGTGFSGGHGYSGGGGPRFKGDSSGKGGSNGSDGEDERGYGGFGSGVDLTQLPVDLFVLAPGAEGMGWGEQRGGGGGGVLIDGEGPEALKGGGEGYGGGAGGKNSLGLPGAVIVEYKELPTPGAHTTTTTTTSTTTTTTTTTTTSMTSTSSSTTTSRTTSSATVTTTTPQTSTVQSSNSCKTNIWSILLIFSVILSMF